MTTDCPECRRNRLIVLKMTSCLAVLLLLSVYVMAGKYDPDGLLEYGLREILVTLIAFLLIVLPFCAALGLAIFRAVVFLLYVFGDTQKLDKFFKVPGGPAAASR